MDFYVEDDKGQVFDVEMQKRNQGNIPKRTRFYQALIDAPMLKSGERGFDNMNPAYIIVICGFDQYGYGLYRYTFENRCKEIKDLTMGDECRKIILNTKGTNDDEVEKSLVDFLHYVDHSSEENVPKDCDDRLKHLHKKIYEIKSNEQMGVSYMKMEERDRLIQEDGERKGQINTIVTIVRRMLEKGYDVNKAADDFELDKKYVKMTVDAISEYGDKSDKEIAEMIYSQAE